MSEQNTTAAAPIAEVSTISKPAVRSLGVIGPTGGLVIGLAFMLIDAYSDSTGVGSADVQQLVGCIAQNPKWAGFAATAAGCALGVWGRWRAKSQIAGVIRAKG